MFVRGGVYRVVKEALGSSLAKVSVSALMFDYVLTGPISGVSAGQYIAGLINEIAGGRPTLMAGCPPPCGACLAARPTFPLMPPSVFFALAITLYFWWQNIKGIEESSDKAMKVMQVTTVMVVILLGWGFFSVVYEGRFAAPLAGSRQSSLQRGSPGISQALQPGQDVRTVRDPDGFRACHSGHERRRDPGPGLSRDRQPQDQEPEAHGADHGRLQPRLYRRFGPAGGDAGARQHPHAAGEQGQPAGRHGDVPGRAAAVAFALPWLRGVRRLPDAGRARSTPPSWAPMGSSTASRKTAY